jgi:hypothetical protein
LFGLCFGWSRGPGSAMTERSHAAFALHRQFGGPAPSTGHCGIQLCLQQAPFCACVGFASCCVVFAPRLWAVLPALRGACASCFGLLECVVALFMALNSWALACFWRGVCGCSRHSACPFRCHLAVCTSGRLPSSSVRT